MVPICSLNLEMRGRRIISAPKIETSLGNIVSPIPKKKTEVSAYSPVVRLFKNVTK